MRIGNAAYGIADDSTISRDHRQESPRLVTNFKFLLNSFRTSTIVFSCIQYIVAVDSFRHGCNIRHKRWTVFTLSLNMITVSVDNNK